MVLLLLIISSLIFLILAVNRRMDFDTIVAGLGLSMFAVVFIKDTHPYITLGWILLVSTIVVLAPLPTGRRAMHYQATRRLHAITVRTRNM